MKSMTDLKYHFGIKIRIYPNDTQKEFIKDCANAQRFIYNQQVFYDHYISDMKSVYGLSRFYNDPMIRDWIDEVNHEKRKITAIKKRYPFLKTHFDSLAGANAQQNHQNAWHQHRQDPKHFGYPTFHRKRDHQYDYRYNTNAQARMDQNGNTIWSVRFDRRYRHIIIPKLKTVKINHIRSILKIKTDYRIGKITVIKDALDHYYVSLQLGSDTPFKKTFPKTGKILAADMNVDDYLVGNNHEIVKNPRYAKTSLPKLIKIQRQLSQMQRHTSNMKKLRQNEMYQKMLYKFHKLSTKVKQQRKDFLEKLSTTIFENQDVLILEDLKSKQILHGNNFHQLHQSISDASWSMFITICQRKAIENHKQLILVNPQQTTQTCSHCGKCKFGDEKITLWGNKKHGTDHDTYVCYYCGYLDSRDHNASLNILYRGLQKLTLQK